MKVPFLSLDRQHRALQEELRTAMDRVLARGWFVRGPEGEAFEAECGATLDGRPCVGVNSGTDALVLALRAAGIGPGDEVITVSCTATPTVMAVLLAGATPVLVDVESSTLTMDPAAAAAAVTPRTKAILPVHLYGHPADLDSLMALCGRQGLLLIEDCAQAQGALYRGRPVGTIGDAAAFSFYPTKNLGAAGDGGLLVARDPALIDRARTMANCGMHAKYQYEEQGMNSRLDELQAAILRVKLPHLPAWNARRRALAARYAAALAGVSGLTLPAEATWAEAVYHLYVVRHGRRADLAAALGEAGIGTLVHYPQSVHQQPPYRLLAPPGGLPRSEAAAATVLSLPLSPDLDEAEVDAVAAAVLRCARGIAASRPRPC